ncbi:MAG TPA: MarR family transcriptional regulator [Bryobacteraceae bacterium]|nr:MarR family transcriptional regulator [Bryobacteraceae bacterium]
MHFQPETLFTRADYRALSRFRYEIRRFLHFSEEAARAEGLEPQQHQLLLAIEGLDDHGSPTIRQLAEHLILRHHSVVGLVDRLEERGLVERVRGAEDRRQVCVRLSAAGSEILHRLSRIHREELRRSGPKLVEALGGVIESVQ